MLCENSLVSFARQLRNVSFATSASQRQLRNARCKKFPCQAINRFGIFGILIGLVYSAGGLPKDAGRDRLWRGVRHQLEPRHPLQAELQRAYPLGQRVAIAVGRHRGNAAGQVVACPVARDPHGSVATKSLPATATVASPIRPRPSTRSPPPRRPLRRDGEEVQWRRHGHCQS